MRDSLHPEVLRYQHELERRCDAARAALPENLDKETPPCFAHMRLLSGGKTREFLLGWRTLARGALTLLHWQDAPLAEVFLSTREGEEYELEVGERMLSGTLLCRSLLALSGGVLSEVVTATATCSRQQAGAWRRVPPRTLG